MLSCSPNRAHTNYQVPLAVVPPNSKIVHGEPWTPPPMPDSPALKLNSDMAANEAGCNGNIVTNTDSGTGGMETKGIRHVSSMIHSARPLSPASSDHYIS